MSSLSMGYFLLSFSIFNVKIGWHSVLRTYTRSLSGKVELHSKRMSCYLWSYPNLLNIDETVPVG